MEMKWTNIRSCDVLPESIVFGSLVYLFFPWIEEKIFADAVRYWTKVVKKCRRYARVVVKERRNFDVMDANQQISVLSSARITRG